MKKVLLLLFASASLSVSLVAQKKARVLTDNINGKISKAEVEFIEYHENSSGDWVRNNFFDNEIFYFDEEQSLIKVEDLRDYKRTDYREKPKPTASVRPATGYQDPVVPTRKADTSYSESDLGKLMTLSYEDGSKIVIGKKNSPPYHTIRSSMNEKGLMTYRAEYRKDGSLESELSFSEKPGSDTLSISMYDVCENMVKYTPY